MKSTAAYRPMTANSGKEAVAKAALAYHVLSKYTAFAAITAIGYSQ